MLTLPLDTSESKVLSFPSFPPPPPLQAPMATIVLLLESHVALTSKGVSRVVPSLTSLVHCRGPQSLGAVLVSCPHSSEAGSPFPQPAFPSRSSALLHNTLNRRTDRQRPPPSELPELEPYSRDGVFAKLQNLLSLVAYIMGCHDCICSYRLLVTQVTGPRNIRRGSLVRWLRGTTDKLCTR